MPGVITVAADDLALPLEEQLLRTSAALDAQGHVIALAPDDPADPARRRIHMVRSALEADCLAIVPLALPPLARTLLAEQLRQLAGTDLGPGVLAGAARLLGHYLHAGALLGSVARLDRVPVGVAQHVKSLVPGRHFAVLAHPEPYLAEAAPANVPPGPGYQTQLAVAGRGLDPAWITGPLAAAWRVRHVREVPLPADSERWWATGKLVEFTAYIADVGMLYQLVTSVRRDACPWCGLDVIGDQCLFCATRLGERSSAGGSSAGRPAPSRRAVAVSGAASRGAVRAGGAVPVGGGDAAGARVGIAARGGDAASGAAAAAGGAAGGGRVTAEGRRTALDGPAPASPDGRKPANGRTDTGGSVAPHGTAAAVPTPRRLPLEPHKR